MYLKKIIKVKYKLSISCLFVILLFSACTYKKKEIKPDKPSVTNINQVITDCNYTFEEATAGTKAPKHIINQLELITVKYYSMDGKIHQGQILANKKITDDLKTIFDYILEIKFPVYQVVPIVRYHWNDELSMKANNTYSFCYRNISFSKHARGMAIDINPLQNPIRWKKENLTKKNKPEGAIYNPETPGTFYPDHPVVIKFKSLGFKWGRNFKRSDDDHHFEKINF